jgi:transcriptional regulator with XRE-family HTH domain
MHNVIRIHKGKQPNRPHYIEAWAEKRGFERQADLAEELNADKSLVSRWYAGATPNREYQEKLAALFYCDRESLFRHPDDDWLSRFLQGRTRDEVEKIKQLLELAFPRTGT